MHTWQALLAMLLPPCTVCSELKPALNELSARRLCLTLDGRMWHTQSRWPSLYRRSSTTGSAGTETPSTQTPTSLPSSSSLRSPVSLSPTLSSSPECICEEARE